MFPNIDRHAEYIAYVKELYLKNLKNSNPIDENDKEEIKVISKHLAMHFTKLRNINDDDYFEWNHGMCLGLAYFGYLQRVSVEPNEIFCREKALMTKHDTLADVIFLMHHIDKKWSNFKLTDLYNVQKYINFVHSKISFFALNADSLKKMNRWNLIKSLNDRYFTLSTNGIMYVVCRAAYHQRNLQVAKVMQPMLQSRPTLEERDVKNLYNWAKEQDTYFSIRKFRMRMINILWTFFNDEPSRCYYTYIRSGEVPTILSHVTASYPSQWISSIQHELLYHKAPELLEHRNPLVQDAVLIALFEAHFKTHYNLAWSRYCMCMEDTILEVYEKLLTVEHPMILKVWGQFYVLWNKQLFPCKRFQEAMVYWFQLLRDHRQSTLFKNINCSNTINRVLPPVAEPRAVQEGIFEVYL
ncbi:MAG: hypothetical protein CMO44_17055 [Verrucomicrobiales bacterium]|nr:hypothetical protein [Verrucomicrobiales bacterium]